MNKNLYKRICDIYCGVTGEMPRGNDFDELGAENLGDFIHALYNVFAQGNNKYLPYFSLWNIGKFSNPIKATDAVEDILTWNPELLEKKDGK